jgi:hypothetical protein
VESGESRPCGLEVRALLVIASSGMNEMKEKALAALPQVVKIAVLGGALLYLVMFVALACMRMSYPHELEWMEGGTIQHVQRVLDGQQIYVEPTLEFTPFIYTPLYFWVAAAASKVLGLGFFSLRLVAFVATLGCAAAILLFVRRETRSFYCGGLSACLYLATFTLTGGWLDISRSDPLFILLLLGSVYALRSKPGLLVAALAGVLLALSFLAKQTALMVAVPLVLYTLISARKHPRLLAFPVVFITLVIVSSRLLDGATDGWFSFYIFELPRMHAFLPEKTIRFWLFDVGQPLSIALGLSLVTIGLMLRKPNKNDFIFFFLLLGGMVGAAWFSRMHDGGYNNVVMPAYAFLAMLFGMGIHTLTASGEESPAGLLGIDQRHFGTAVMVLCLIQFLSLSYDPRLQLPTAADRQAADSFSSTLKAFEGDVLVPYHGELASRSGKLFCAQGMALNDVLRMEDSKIQRKLEDEIATAIQSGTYDAIVLDEPWYWFMDEIEQAYEFKGSLFDRNDIFWPVSGVRLRPEFLYVRR